jgi:hypothetical protein
MRTAAAADALAADGGIDRFQSTHRSADLDVPGHGDINNTYSSGRHPPRGARNRSKP